MKKELMDQIIGEAKALYPKAIEWRRDFHKYAESGWTEFRTAAVIAEKLYGLGFDVLVGDQIFDDATMMGVPDKKILEAHQERAIAEGWRKNRCGWRAERQRKWASSGCTL